MENKENISEKPKLEDIMKKYGENIRGRSGFTLAMLQDRWNMTREQVIFMLDEYKIPGHIVDHSRLNSGGIPEYMIDVAIFFSEYIIGIEFREHLPHKKLKPIKIAKRN